MGTAVALRGEEPPAKVLRSSYTCSLHPPVSERQSGFVVWAQLAGKYKVLPSRQPHLLRGEAGREEPAAGGNNLPCP